MQATTWESQRVLAEIENAIYWRPNGVRVAINGHHYDMGKRSIESCHKAGEQLYLRVVILAPDKPRE